MHDCFLEVDGSPNNNDLRMESTVRPLIPEIIFERDVNFTRKRKKNFCVCVCGL